MLMRLCNHHHHLIPGDFYHPPPQKHSGPNAGHLPGPSSCKDPTSHSSAFSLQSLPSRVESPLSPSCSRLAHPLLCCTHTRHGAAGSRGNTLSCFWATASLFSNAPVRSQGSHSCTCPQRSLPPSLCRCPAQGLPCYMLWFCCVFSWWLIMLSIFSCFTGHLDIFLQKCVFETLAVFKLSCLF